MDGPEPEKNIMAWGREMARYVESTPNPELDWLQIQADAEVETKERLIQNSIQKNYSAVDFILDHPYQKLPDNLLLRTQNLTKETHKMEVIP
jgi:hypothetical protein